VDAEAAEAAALNKKEWTALGSVCAVLGSQWGDEGKGKLVDILAQVNDCQKAQPPKTKNDYPGEQRAYDPGGCGRCLSAASIARVFNVPTSSALGRARGKRARVPRRSGGRRVGPIET